MAQIPFQVRNWQREPVRLQHDPGNGRRNPRWQRIPTPDAPPIVTARIVVNGDTVVVALTGGWTVYHSDGTLAHLLPYIAEEVNRRMPHEWRHRKR